MKPIHLLLFILMMSALLPKSWAEGGTVPNLSLSAPPAPSWTLSELIQEGLKSNPELSAYQERWKAAKARVWKEISWEDTMAGADFEGIPRGRADLDRAKDIEWMVSQKIPFPGKKLLRGRVASKEAQRVEADYHAKERELVSEIKKAYFEYFLKDHEIRLHEDTLGILAKLSRSTEAQYATSQIPYAEVLKIHTELATRANEVARHYQERETALARLNALLGRNANESLKITISIPENSLSFKRDDLMKLALDQRPELQAMHFGYEAAKTGVTSAWWDLWPDAQVRVEARQFEGEGRIREYDQFFGFEVPIFSLMGRAGAIKEKQAEKRAAKGFLENMRNQVLYEVQKNWAEFESSDRTVKMYESNVIPQAEAIFQASLAGYESGQGGFSVLMEAQKNVTEFRHHYFEALAMREQSLAELERVVGVNLGGGVLQ